MSDPVSARPKMLVAQLIALGLVIVVGLGLFFWFAPKTPVVVTPTVVE